MKVLPALAKTVFAGFLVSLLLGLTAAFGTRLGFWDYHFGLLSLFPWAVGIGIAAFLVGLVWMLWAMIANDSSGARYGLIGFFGAAIFLYTPITDFWTSYGAPPIHDISTDTEHAPIFASLLTQRAGATNSPDYDGPNLVMFKGKRSTVSALQHKYEGDVRPAPVLTSPEKLFRRALNTVRGMGWNIVAIAPDEGRIEATDTTFFFGFTDDIVIRVKPAGMGARLDIRSKARVGDNDGGRDARRIVAFMKQLAGKN
ncbi:MAG TPA: DUF1499 domain-containing protein [Rhizomicrobium sp.]